MAKEYWIFHSSVVPHSGMGVYFKFKQPLDILSVLLLWLIYTISI